MNFEALSERLFGAHIGSALDVVSRSAYKSDEDYLLAAAKLDMERNTPEFQAAMQRVTDEHNRRMDEQRRQQEREERDRLLSTTRLDHLEQQDVDKRATEAAQADLAAKRIFAQDFPSKIKEYQEQYTEKSVRSKVDRIQANNAFRKMAEGQM